MGPDKISGIHVNTSIGIITCLGNNIVEIHGCSFADKTLSQSRYPHGLAFTIFPIPLLSYSLNWCKSCVADGSIGAGHSIATCSLQLFPSVIVSICSKNKSLMRNESYTYL